MNKTPAVQPPGPQMGNVFADLDDAVSPVSAGATAGQTMPREAQVTIQKNTAAGSVEDLKSFAKPAIYGALGVIAVVAFLL